MAFSELFSRGLALLVLCASAPAGPAQVGDPAPEIAATEWLNWVGEPPALKNLQGHTVLLHFFTTTKPEKQAWWPVLRKYQHEHSAKGLIVIALCAESTEVVMEYMQENNLPFIVGTGATCAPAWGAPTEGFFQALVDRHGDIYWQGPTNGLWNGKLLKALKGSKRMDECGPLRLHLEGDYDGRCKKAQDYCAEGRLGKALDALERASEDECAVAIQAALESHVEELRRQIDLQLERREVIIAFAALEALAKELRGTPLGEAAQKRLALAEGDASLQRELSAAIEYEDLIDALMRRGWEKNQARFQKLIDDYPGTLAALKSRNVLQHR